jgi:hypothetical protein
MVMMYEHMLRFLFFLFLSLLSMCFNSSTKKSVIRPPALLHLTRSVRHFAKPLLLARNKVALFWV